MLLRRGPDAISPTAHYTGHVWSRNGMSHPALATREGFALYMMTEPLMRVGRLFGRPTFEGLLVARHRVIDAELAAAIDDGRVGQVVEVACGMSPRGLRFCERYGERITYVEADLPAMAARKRAALADAGADPRRHRVADVDALRDDGPTSLSALAATLDPGVGTAIVTEGLLNYFGRDDVEAIWRRFADVLSGFPHGLHLADLYLEVPSDALLERAAIVALSAFVRGRVHLHYPTPSDAAAALRDAGFGHVDVLRAIDHAAVGDLREDPGAAQVRIVRARV